MLLFARGLRMASFSVAVTPLSAPRRNVGDATVKVRLVATLVIVMERAVALGRDEMSPENCAVRRALPGLEVTSRVVVARPDGSVWPVFVELPSLNTTGLPGPAPSPVSVADTVMSAPYAPLAGAPSSSSDVGE